MSIVFQNEGPNIDGYTINIYNRYSFDEWLKYRNDKSYRSKWAQRYNEQKEEQIAEILNNSRTEQMIDKLVQSAFDKAISKYFK